METIIDYVFRKEKSMDALDLWTKKNIRKLIREEDKKTKKMGGEIDWNYLLNHVDSEF